MITNMDCPGHQADDGSVSRCDGVCRFECAWFAMCFRQATSWMPHPIYKRVPICDQCRDTVNVLSGAQEMGGNAVIDRIDADMAIVNGYEVRIDRRPIGIGDQARDIYVHVPHGLGYRPVAFSVARQYADDWTNAPLYNVPTGLGLAHPTDLESAVRLTIGEAK